MITNQFTRKLVTTFATLVSRKLLVGPLFVHLEDFVSSVFFFFFRAEEEEQLLMDSPSGALSDGPLHILPF